MGETGAVAHTVDERPAAQSPWRARLARRPLWVRVTAVYLGIRVLSGVLLALAAQDQVWFPAVTGPAEDDIDLTVSWDAKWYERIATEGYPDDLPVGDDGRVRQNPWAFYPLLSLIHI